jgi:2-oxoisovalerate dehydrogenase E1 component
VTESTSPAPPRPAPLTARLAAFVAERYPFALDLVREAVAAALPDAAVPEASGPRDGHHAALLRPLLRDRLAARLATGAGDRELPDPVPGASAERRLDHAAAELLDACDGFLRREVLAASFSRDERREMLRGMVLTRAVDNRLKAFFVGGDVRWGGKAFQGKGFRSLGQEAIYAAPLRLRRGERWRGEDGSWRGDVVAPVIRDAGAALAMHPEPETVRRLLNAQMGKAGPPMEGRDLHIGDFERGVLPPSAPLAVATATVAGIAFAFQQQDEPGDGRVAVSFIGEGGTSLGEWHEAVNVCAARRLPAVFCVQNNQTALSTPVPEQSAVRIFADKAVGYGIPGITVDGTDPEAIAAAFAWAAERARAGLGPVLIELVAMRMCGHAHHDDMLYLGRDPQPGWTYPPLHEGGYADPEAYRFWAARDPIATYAARLEAEGVIDGAELDRLKEEAESLVNTEARAVIEAPWPSGETAGEGVFARGDAARQVEVLENRPPPRIDRSPALPPLEPGLPFVRDGRTFLEAVMLGVGDALAADPRVFVYGEDVGGAYGNAFLLLRPLLERFGDRILNSPIAEAGILGVCVGAALAGQRPIGEIQFNDFVATGFNQLVNNAAKVHYRWGRPVPMVVRMPWGGLRSAGPYHSQNTEAWFYRTPGLKIVAPSTPQDARALLAAAVADPDPVLFYEHIALYREPSIKQALPEEAPEPLPLGRAALRRAAPALTGNRPGKRLALISYGAYVHVALRVAERLAADGIEASVLDLRSLVPLDREAVLAVARHAGKVLVCHEDTRTGGLGESLAAIIQEEAFEYLDAPVRVVGALDAPVPYSPPLEEAFLPGEERIERAARLLAAY